MDWSAPLAWQPSGWDRVVTIDSHTGGEPFRVIVEGAPQVIGDTMIERRRYAESRLDDLRRALMWEPRGHADMYGGIPGPPVEPGSDLSVLFLHNDGFSTMCGHGIIALAKVVLDTAVIPVTEPETRLRIDTPAGTVEAFARIEGGSVASVRFRNVPSFVADLDAEVDVPGLGPVRYDLAFGGAFYAYVSSEDLGVRLEPGDAGRLIEVGRSIKQAIVASGPVVHPLEPELGFLYGVILTGPPRLPTSRYRNVCIFANGEVDRSPTGTGVSGRLAIEHARGRLDLGETIAVESILASVFWGRLLSTTELAGTPAVLTEVEGTAAITGRNEMWLHPDDELGRGFLLR